MASIKKRGKSYCVIYRAVKNGKKNQIWETYKTYTEAKKRKAEIEFRSGNEKLTVPACRTLEELLGEYVEVYGMNRWSYSTLEGKKSLIRNYILPAIGHYRLNETDTRTLDRFYRNLLNSKAVENRRFGKGGNPVTPATIREINKLLHSCFAQAVRWQLIGYNPCDNVTLPKHKEERREIWSEKEIAKALDACEDEVLEMAINLSFAASLRLGELLALTWDGVSISEESVKNKCSYVRVNKTLQRISVESYEALNGKDVYTTFPPEHPDCKTIRVLKTPKSQSSIRKVYIPETVAEKLLKWKEKQDTVKEMLGDEYQDYNLVMASPFGGPVSDSQIRKGLKKLSKENDLPDVVFHSIRHSSITFKLKLTSGDIKAVQGDSGHSQARMITDVYGHILDDDRSRTASEFEKRFYGKSEKNDAVKTEIPDNIDSEKLFKLLNNPNLAQILAVAEQMSEQKM